MELEAAHLKPFEILAYMRDFARSEYFCEYSSSGKLQVPPVVMDFAFPELARVVPYLETIIEDYTKNSPPARAVIRGFMFAKAPEKEKERYGFHPESTLLVSMNAGPNFINFSTILPLLAGRAEPDSYERWESKVKEELVKAIPALR